MPRIALPRADFYRLKELPDLLARARHPTCDVDDDASERYALDRVGWDQSIADAQFRHEFAVLLQETTPEIPASLGSVGRAMIRQEALKAFLTKRGFDAEFYVHAQDPGSIRKQILRGYAVILDFEVEWAGEQAALKGDGPEALPGLQQYLRNNFAEALQAGLLKVFDPIRKQERPYRESDHKDLAGGMIPISSSSFAAWCGAEGIPCLSYLASPASTTFVGESQRLTDAPIAKSEATKPEGPDARFGSRKRRDLLADTLNEAASQCADPSNIAQVWHALCQMAERKKRPLLGVTEEGVQWVNDKEEIKYLSKKNLGQRLNYSRRTS